MSLTFIGDSLYMDDSGKLYKKENGKKTPLVTPESKAEDRYVERHLKGGKKNE